MSEFRFFAYTDFAFEPNKSMQNVISLPIHPYEAIDGSIDVLDDGQSAGGAHELNVPYTIFEILVAVFAVVGNLMVIIVFQRERKLRRRTNYYIVSLAMADFLVGSLGVPFAIFASIGLPTNLYACLFTVSLLIVLCTISIFCLVAVSVDRYWAILYPMAYSRNVRTKTAIVIISLCWLAGSVVGFLPLFGWHSDVPENQACLFTKVMDYNYLVFLYFATIITPALLMLAFYVHIYRVIVKQVRQIVTMNPVSDGSRRSSTTAQIQTTPYTANTPRSCHGGTMLRVLGASRKREVKATQNLSIIVLFFMICWFPLYTINCIQAFCDTCAIPPKLTLFCIILSHLNSAVNPVLYAYHLRDFRAALKNLILRIMGVDVEPTVDAAHRFSMASQNRLQSIDVSTRNTLHPRIYIDSPIWLRQQQQQALQQGAKYGGISPCLNNLNQTMMTPITPDLERPMWNIREVSSGQEVGEINYVFPDEDGTATGDRSTPTSDGPHSTPVSLQRCQRRCNTASCTGGPEHADTYYSYDNHNYSTSAGDTEASTGSRARMNDAYSELDVADEVFLPSVPADCCASPKRHSAKPLNTASEGPLASALRAKLQLDEANYLTNLYRSECMLSDSSCSDCDAAPQGRLLANTATTASLCSSPRLLGKKLVPATTCALQASRPHSKSACAVDTAPVYVIEQDDALSLTPHAEQRGDSHSGRTTLSRHGSGSCSCSCRSSSQPSGMTRYAAASPALHGKRTSPSGTPPSSGSDAAGHHSSAHSTPHANGALHTTAAATALSSSTPDAHATVNYNCSNSSSNNNNNNTATSHTADNLHFYAQQQQRHKSCSAAHHSQKFSPLKAVSHFLFPPIVKHSSLFQLFHTYTTAPTPTTATLTSASSCDDELTAVSALKTPSSIMHAISAPLQSTTTGAPPTAECSNLVALADS